MLWRWRAPLFATGPVCARDVLRWPSILLWSQLQTSGCKASALCTLFVSTPGGDICASWYPKESTNPSRGMLLPSEMKERSLFKSIFILWWWVWKRQKEWEPFFYECIFYPTPLRSTQGKPATCFLENPRALRGFLPRWLLFNSPSVYHQM